MTTENIQINIREDGSREVIVNINRVADTMDNASKSADFFGQAMKRLVGIFSAGYLLKQFAEFADTMTLLDARLKLVTKSTTDYMQAQQDLYDISQRNNVGLKETGQLYVRLADPVKRLGGGIKEVSAIIDAFSTSLRISGVSQQEAASATLQFAQAMGSGKLAGDEFRSLSENAPRFMQVLADSLNVPTGALKGMATEGKLTSDVIGNALIKSLGKLQDESKSLSNTIGGSLSDLRNDTLITVGAFDKLTGTSGKMADAIQGVSLLVFELGQIFKEDFLAGSKAASGEMDTMETTIRILGPAFEAVTITVANLAYYLKTTGRALGAVGAQVAAISQGEFKRALDIGKEFRDDQEQSKKELDDFVNRVSGLTERTLAARAKQTEATNYGAQATLKAVQSDKELIDARMRLTGINKKYFEDMATFQGALDAGKISQQEYINLMSELATKTYAASAAGKEARKNLVGSDDRMKVMQDQIVIAQTAFDQEKSIYEARLHIIDTYHKDFGTTETEFYEQRENARVEYLKSEQASYDRERSIIESFKPVGAKEVADQKLRLDKLERQHEQYVNKINAARGEDAVSRAAYDHKVVESSDDMTNAFLSDLQKQIDKNKEANTQRDEGLASVQREYVAKLDLAIAYQEQFIAQQSVNGATAEEIAQGPKILKFLQDQRRLRSELADTLDEKEFLKAQAEYVKAVDATSRKIQDGLYAAIVKGGSSGFKKLLSDVKEWFARLVLSPIIQPIANYGANIVQQMFGTSGQGQNLPGGISGAGGTGNSMMSMLSTGKSLFDLWSKGFAGMTSNLGSMITSLGNMFGSSSMSAFGSGMGMTSSQAAAAANAYGSAGMSGTGSAISGGSSFASMAPYAGMIAMGMGLSNALFNKGWNPNNGSIQKSTWAVPIAQESLLFNKVFKAFGMSDKAASIFSGAPIVSALWGRKAPQITSQGIRGTASADSVTGEQYANILEKGGWFRSDKRYTKTAALDSDMINTIKGGIGDLKVATDAFGKSIGLNTGILDSYRKTFDLSFGTDQQKNVETFNTFLTQVGNEMATLLIPNIQQFAKYGETASQTLSRLADIFVATDAVAKAFGKTASDMFGGIGLASEAARERLVTYAGGVSQLQTSVNAYMDAFLTDAEKLKPVQDALNEAMSSLGISGVTTKEQFKALVNSLDLTTEAGTKMFVQLMNLAPAFAQITDASDALKQKELDRIKAEQDAAAQAAKDAADAAEAARQAELAKVKAHQKEVADILLGDAESVFERLQRSVDAVKANIQKDYEAHDAILGSQIEAATSNLAALQNVSRAVQSTLDGMKLEESASFYRQQSQQVIKDAITAVRAGQSVDQDALQKALGVVSQTNEDMFASASDFRRDFYTTANSLYDLSQSTDGRIDVAQASLDTLNEQRDLLKQSYEAQIDALDKQMQAAQDQLNLLKGVDTSVGDLNHLFTWFAGYVTSVKADPVAGANAAITEAYMKYVGYNPGGGEMAYWQKALDDGQTLSQIIDQIKSTTTAVAFQNSLRAQGINPDTYVPQVPTVGADLSWMTQNQTGSGSAITPTGFQPIVVNNDELVSLLEDIRQELRELNETTESTSADLENLTGMIDRVTAGGNAMLVQDVGTL